MIIVLPEKLLEVCNKALSEYVKIGFTKFEGGEGTMYFADYYTIKESEHSVWEAVRKMGPQITRLTIEQALVILCNRAGIVLQKSADDSTTNEDQIFDCCRLAVGRHVQRELDRQVKLEEIK